jgi:hypothetical protein
MQLTGKTLQSWHGFLLAIAQRHFGIILLKLTNRWGSVALGS